MICPPLDLKLQICLIQLFPDLNKIVFLDDDVVVQHDLSSLWDINLGGNVVGAVLDSWCGDGCCSGRKYSQYLNFSHPLISSNFDPDRCTWLYGVNIFDLEAWRKTNITSTYHQWLKHVSSHAYSTKFQMERNYCSALTKQYYFTEPQFWIGIVASRGTCSILDGL